MADNDRWSRFEFRPGDIVISTPSKCGTTWMQHIIVRLILESADLDAPIGSISPWLDARVQTEEEVFEHLADQRHRRVVKTHTPFDGLPRPESVLFIAMARHPLDVALSFRDHFANVDQAQVGARIEQSSGFPDVAPRESPPEDDADYLAWWIENDIEPDGAGPYGLADFCNSIRTSWEARAEPNVKLIHYSDLLATPELLIGEVAAFLGIEAESEMISMIAAATSLGLLRSDATSAAPFGDLGFWTDPERFFRVGGRRGWADLVPIDRIERLHQRVDELAPGTRDWILR